MIWELSLYVIGNLIVPLLAVCSDHITYTFQSESTLYICPNVKELLARGRHKIWSLSECNWIRTHNHLVHKQTLNHLATVSLFFYSYKKGKQVFGGWWSFIFRKKLKPCFCLNMDPKRGIYHYHFTIKVLTFFFSNTA